MGKVKRQNSTCACPCTRGRRPTVAQAPGGASGAEGVRRTDYLSSPPSLRTTVPARTFRDPPRSGRRAPGSMRAAVEQRARGRGGGEGARAASRGGTGEESRPRYLGAEGLGLPAERARGRGKGPPESPALLGAQRSPDTRALHLAGLVRAPTPPVPPAIPSRAGRGGRGGEPGGGAAGGGPPPISGPAPDNPPASDAGLHDLQRVAHHSSACGGIKSGVGGATRPPPRCAPPCPSRSSPLPRGAWGPALGAQGLLEGPALSMPFRRMRGVEHREEKKQLGTRSPAPHVRFPGGRGSGLLGPCCQFYRLSPEWPRSLKAWGGGEVGIALPALTLSPTFAFPRSGKW